ncbi:MAG: homoserine kinase [Geminicoccaceae bacterium]|nr:MAG: homoserine kinase [Geminicoccaceae bacterium]
MAVFTPLDQSTVEAFVDGYELGVLVRWHGIQEGVENSNFYVETSQNRSILTIYEKRVRKEDLPFFLGLMEHLAAAGVPCPVPLHDREGRVLRTLHGKPAALVSFLDGRSTRTITPDHCRALGEALAGLHEAGRGFVLERENDLGVHGWGRLVAMIGERADEVEPGLAAELAKELAYLQAAWPRTLPAGVIHADLFPDNVFFADTAVSGLIDFYFSCNDQLAYDLAICLDAWCFLGDGSLDLARSAALLAGYQARRRLGPAERAALPLLCRGAAFRFLLTRLYDWLNHPEGALVTPKDPTEYLRLNRFHRHVTDAAAYGLR